MSEIAADPTSRVRAALPAACSREALHWIAGEWVASRSGETFETVNPSTGTELYRIALGGRPEIDAAVDAALVAQTAWWEMDGQDRSRILRNLADVIRANAQALGLFDTLDAGRPIRDTVSHDCERAARIFEFFAGTTDRLRGATIPAQPGKFNYTLWEPYGVVGAITPWNYPLTNAITKIAPALATGNAVVLKPAEESPLSALLFAHIAHEAGLPAGVLNVVNGLGEVTGAALVEHPAVRKIAFTGSTEVGRLIGKACGESLKSVTLELGGKTPNIVFADADLPCAADAALFTAFNNQGQTCTAGTRLLVEEDVAEAFLAALKERAQGLRIGDPLDYDTRIGPLISAKQLERVLRYVEEGTKTGARPIALGSRLDKSKIGAGYFLTPIVFADARPDMRIVREEIFGPVLVLTTFADEDEAVARANDNAYGLAAALWTTSASRAQRMARRLEAGLVWINTVHSLHPGSPYGGYKQSGVGLEMGLEAVSQYMRVKSVWMEAGRWQSPWS